MVEGMNESVIIARYAIEFATLTIISFILIKRNVSQYKENNEWNWARTFVILAITSVQIFNLFRFLYIGFGLYPNLVSDSLKVTSFSTVLAALSMVFGFIFVAYINEWISLMLFPIFFLIGCVVFYFITGYSEFLYYFMIVGGSTVVFTLIEEGIRLKDSSVLGLGLFFIFDFIAVVFTGTYIAVIVPLLGQIFGIYYAMGKFDPFNKEKKQQKKEVKKVKFDDKKATEKSYRDLIIEKTTQNNEIMEEK